jgi:hypothetical protein
MTLYFSVNLLNIHFQYFQCEYLRCYKLGCSYNVKKHTIYSYQDFQYIQIVKIMWVGLLFTALNALSTDNFLDEEISLTNTVSLVVASMGRPNLDDEPEDLTWLAFGSGKSLYLYDRTNHSSPYYINTDHGRECLTYMKYITDFYENLPR